MNILNGHVILGLVWLMHIPVLSREDFLKTLLDQSSKDTLNVRSDTEVKGGCRMLEMVLLCCLGMLSRLFELMNSKVRDTKMCT